MQQKWALSVWGDNTEGKELEEAVTFLGLSKYNGKMQCSIKQQESTGKEIISAADIEVEE